MIVRIRFGRGPLVTRRKGKNGKAALLLASLLTLLAVSFGVLGVWRICQDLGFAGDFVFADGFLSHWQVWIAAAAASQYACLRLTRYSRQSQAPADEVLDEDLDTRLPGILPRGRSRVDDEAAPVGSPHAH